MSFSQFGKDGMTLRAIFEGVWSKKAQDVVDDVCLEETFGGVTNRSIRSSNLATFACSRNYKKPCICFQNVVLDDAKVSNIEYKQERQIKNRIRE